MKYELKDFETACVLNKQLTKENEFLKTELTSKNEVIKLIINERETIEDIPLHPTKSHDVNRCVVSNNSKTHQHNTPVNKNKNNKIEIIGDSLLNGLNDCGLSKNGIIKTRKYPGASTNDMIYHAIPTIERKPEIIICHAGTNDLTNKIDTITNCQTIVNKIKKKSPHTKIAISSLIIHKDKPG